MSRLHINKEDRKRIVKKWVERSLWLLHIWACACIIIITITTDANVISALVNIFSTCTFGIGLTLGVLIVDNGADLLMLRFGVNTKKEVDNDVDNSK